MRVAFTTRLALRCIGVPIAWAAAVVSSHAQVSINFDTLGTGTVVTNQYPEVTFSSSAGMVNTVLTTSAHGSFLCSGQIGQQPNCVQDTYLDFTSPVSNLHLLAVEANCFCHSADFRVFVNGVLAATIPFVGGGGAGSSVPVDLSTWSGVTRLEIVNILVASSEGGIGWDAFTFDVAVAPSFCLGDGSGTPCPCGNTTLAGPGCPNSVFAAGARLDANGIASLTTDTLTLRAQSLPDGPGLFVQGSALIGGGAGITFGDGTVCLTGAIIRLGLGFASAGVSIYPNGATPIHVAGAVSVGDLRHYQLWYRDGAQFCTPATFNLTSGTSITWHP